MTRAGPRSSWNGCGSAGLKPEDLHLRALGGRRQPGEERQPEPRHGACNTPGGRRPDHRHRGQGRRLHGQGGRRRASIVPTVNPEHITPHSEAFQAVVWHLLVSHPRLKAPCDQVGVSPMSLPPVGVELRRAVFLDRDGVLNRAIVRDGRPFPPESPEAFEILPGAAEAVRRLHDAGFLLIVATNQPDVARGTQRREVVEAMNARLLDAMPIDEIRVCYEDGDDCPRRKPNPGLLLEAAQAHGIDLPESYMVGDRWRDVEAGRMRRLPHRLHRPGLRRTTSGAPRRSRRHGPPGCCGLDPFAQGTDHAPISILFHSVVTPGTMESDSGAIGTMGRIRPSGRPDLARGVGRSSRPRRS